MNIAKEKKCPKPVAKKGTKDAREAKSACVSLVLVSLNA